MKSGNGLLKGCLYFWGGLFLLGLLVRVALPLAICGLIGFGAYLAYKRWRYPLLKDRSLEDQIELLKARILEGLEPRTKPPKDGEVKSMSKKQKARIKEKREEKKKADMKKKAKLRHKDTKNIGKRRKPSAEKTAEK